MPRGLAQSRGIWVLLLAGGCLLVFLLAYHSPVSYAGADPHPTLLVSQAILEQGTIRMDAYRTPENASLDTWLRQAKNGHYYYYWPLGPSVLSLPAVWVAVQACRDMQRATDNYDLQNLLSAALCGLVLLVFYAISRCFVAAPPSLAIALISLLGSSLISTMGTALWNIDFAVLFISLAVWLLCRLENGHSWKGTPWILGVLMFGAYFCRPSTATFIIVAFAYLSIRQRSILLPTAGAALALFVLFTTFSWLEYGRLMPEYYSVERFQRFSIPVWLVVYGHLLSPSRGLLIYNPWFAWVIGWVVVLFRQLRSSPLFWFCVVWLVLHIIVVSRSAKWWGGHSYGPRILCELIPACVVLTALVWQELTARSGRGAQRIAATGFLAFGLLGILINSVQGLNNLDTARWNGTPPPNIDSNPEYLLDWRYPQFLASPKQLCARNEDLMQRSLSDLRPYNLGSSVRHDDPGRQAVFVGWSKSEGNLRWSECVSARVLFQLDTVDPGKQYALQIESGSFGVQPVTVLLNGTPLRSLVFPGLTTPPVTQTIFFDGSLLKPGALNEIEFYVPNSARPENNDLRTLGLALVELSVRSVE